MLRRRRIVATIALNILLLAPRTGRAQDEEALAPLMAQYWHRRVEVVQPRAVEKAHRFELALFAGVIPNDAFLLYFPVGARLGYHLNEHWALELSGEYNLAVNTGLRTFLVENDAALRVQLRERQQLRTSVSGSWSPLYGKLALGRHVLHFDLYLIAGAGIVRTSEEKAIDLPAAICPDFHGGLGGRLFLGPRWLLRLEYRHYLFLRPEDGAGRGGGVGVPAELALAVGVLLGGGHRAP